ncbi:MAG: MFS transporter [Pseudoclavibacter sp.]
MILTCTVLAQLVLMVMVTIVMISLPEIQSTLNLSDTDRTWVVTAYLLPFGALMLFGGKLSQRIGVRPAFLVGIIGFAVMSIAGGFAPNFAILMVARVAQGVFAAILAPANLSLISTTFVEPKERGRAFVLFGSAGGAGAALGLLFGGIITQALNWRWCFFVVAIVALIVGILAISAIKGVGKAEPGRLTADLIGLVLGCAGLFGLIYGLSEAGRSGWGSVATISFIIAGAVLLVLFVIRERFAAEPVLPLWVVKDARRASSNIVMLFGGCAQLGAFLYLTYYLQKNLHYSATVTGVAILPMIAIFVAASLVASHLLIPRIGVGFIFPLGTLIQAIGFFILSALSPSSTYASIVLPSLIVVGIGMGFAMPAAFSAGTHRIPSSHSGVASALLNSSQQLGGSFGVAYLSTYATQHIATAMSNSAAAIHAEIAQAIAAAGVTADSARGQQIASATALHHEGIAAIAAYAGGFQVIAWVCVAATVVLGIIAVATRKED